jgi:hypothetical protein
VIERLLETWLNRANERSFQVPFCHSLAFEGYTVVHMTRHCAMEVGKDILALAPDGIPCAYQLKGVDGGRLTLSAWRDDLSKQLHPLVHRKIVHPSIPPHEYHRSYIVINGDFDEEVLRDIDDFNRSSVDAGQPERKVETIVKGQLFKRFKDLQDDFWATNLNDLKTYLELLTANGRGQLPKERLCALLESALPFKDDSSAPTVNECARALAGCAIICSSAISPFTNANNHLAEFEAWTLFWAYTLALAEKSRLSLAKVNFVLSIAQEAIYTSLGRLCDELMGRKHFVEGDVLLDWPVYRVRMTHVLGLMGIYGLWRTQRVKEGLEDPDEARDTFLRSFCKEHGKRTIWLWGEYAIPQILAYIFYLRTIDATPASDVLIHTLIQAITRKNRPGSDGALANPYYDAEATLPHVLGLESKPLRDSFSGSSYLLEGLTHLFVRANFKQQMFLSFPEITRIGFRSFVPDQPWQFYFWRNRGTGMDQIRFLQPPHRWGKLRAEAAESQGKDLPELLQQFPIQYLCFICVLPHRATAGGLRWASTRLEEL